MLVKNLQNCITPRANPTRTKDLRERRLCPRRVPLTIDRCGSLLAGGYTVKDEVWGTLPTSCLILL